MAVFQKVNQMRDTNEIVDSADIMALSTEGFYRLAAFVTGELGIKMPDSKISMIQSRLVRRVRELGLHSVEQYSEYLFAAENHEEREHFINAITTNKTDFFREPEHFLYLTNVALPSLRKNAEYDPRHTRVWSAACSSGEEPYTLAMVLSEYSRLFADFDFAILGTDVSTRVLQKAKRGIYSEEQVAPVPLEIRRRYLLQSKNEDTGLVRIIPDLRQKVSFHRMNFMEPKYHIREHFDIIFLRNVLIYFDKPTQESVVNKVCAHLKPGGYLFVSHSESLSDVDVAVKRVHTSVHRLPM
jgi:chemotaxis protein methyltransferase CheR